VVICFFSGNLVYLVVICFFSGDFVYFCENLVHFPVLVCLATMLPATMPNDSRFPAALGFKEWPMSSSDEECSLQEIPGQRHLHDRC
jgi:hypothetical protein